MPLFYNIDNATAKNNVIQYLFLFCPKLLTMSMRNNHFEAHS